MSESIGFIGLGNLGLPIASNLLEAGHALTVYNRTASKADSLVARGAKRAETPAGCVSPGGVVFSILWDDASLEELVQSAGFLERLGPGGVHVSMTTVTPAMARKVAALHEASGSSYVESPVFGVPAQAKAKQLTSCQAGPKAAKDRVRPFVEATGAQKIVDFGEAIGAGTSAKLAGNYLIVSALGAIREMYSVLEKTGADSKAIIEMLTSTIFTIPQYQRYGLALANKTPLSSSGIPLKDLGLFKDLARSGAAATPLADTLEGQLALVARGG